MAVCFSRPNPSLVAACYRRSTAPLSPPPCGIHPSGSDANIRRASRVRATTPAREATLRSRNPQEIICDLAESLYRDSGTGGASCRSECWGNGLDGNAIAMHAEIHRRCGVATADQEVGAVQCVGRRGAAERLKFRQD